ncbi:MAG: hypothetical protein LBV73_08430 [Paraburkholderia sp.]|jgi:hypothetical protein|nr:hypothetical protein [Paraburkholderia sp.]
MARPDSPEDLPIDERAHDGNAFERDGSPAVSGAGLSVALNVAFYLIVLAVGIGYDHTHRLRSPRSGVPGAFSANWLARVHAPLFPLMPLEAIGPVRVLLDQAHDCVLAGQWDCVNAATHAAIALRGEASGVQPGTSPEARTLLAQANVNEVWISSHANAARPAGIGRDERLKVAVHVSAPYERERRYRHTGHTGHTDASILARKTVARPASPEFLADLYRH